MNLGTGSPGSCASCEARQCPLHAEQALSGIAREGEAWLLDEKWAEFNVYLAGSARGRPLVFSPWPGFPGRKAAYDWQFPASCRRSATPWLTLRRGLALRRCGQQGRRRQEVIEEFDRRFAAAYAARLPCTTTRLVVWQNLLPFLHLDKTLGGREYDVLLGRAPRHVLQATLDEARARYPESPTLGDFRSSPYLVEAERAALAGARRIVTPHRHLARLYPEKTTLLDWSWPKSKGEPLSGQTDRPSSGRLWGVAGPMSSEQQ